MCCCVMALFVENTMGFNFKENFLYLYFKKTQCATEDFQFHFGSNYLQRIYLQMDGKLDLYLQNCSIFSGPTSSKSLYKVKIRLKWLNMTFL